MMQENERSLKDLTHAVITEMRRTNFKEATIAQYEDVWNKLTQFANKQEQHRFTLKLGQDFLEEEYGLMNYPKTNRISQMRLRAIHMLEIYQLHQVLPLRVPTKYYNYADPFKEVFECFVKHRRLIGITEKTIKANQIYLERFSNYLYNHGIKTISDIDVPAIQGFVRTLSIYKPPTIYCTLGMLRILLRFLHEQKYLQTDLSNHVPSMNYRSLIKIPSAYSKGEVEAIIDQIDRGNPKGKRDYAMVLLAARLGLRASDICNLSFSAVRWELNTIEIIQRKTKEPLVLPLLDDIGEALVDYLKFGRPPSELPFIFLRHIPPMDQLTPPTLHSIITHYMQMAGVPVSGEKKHGPHALRHSLAGILLQGYTPFPVISGILGHKNRRATSIYLKIDVVQLKNCALEVPAYTVVKKEDSGNE